MMRDERKEERCATRCEKIIKYNSKKAQDRVKEDRIKLRTYVYADF